MRRLWVLFATLLATCTASFVVLMCVSSQSAPTPDVATANDFLIQASKQWPAPRSEDYGGDISFSITDLNGRVLAARGPAVSDQLDALRLRYWTLDIIVDGVAVGRLFLADGSEAKFHVIRSITLLSAAAGMLAVSAVAFAAMLWQHSRIIKPFRRLKLFAKQIALGHLEAALPMDRAEAFGAFTEAFDLMREELRKSKEREENLRESRQNLVAQLSHDIRTPLASIRANADLLSLQKKASEEHHRMDVIIAKADQIKFLLDDLFRANQEDVPDLDVQVEDHTTTELLSLLNMADSRCSITQVQIPPALIAYDEHRLLQVLDNVLTNAAKYAGTAVWVRGTLDNDHLVVALRDTGPGLDQNELATLTARGVRGSNSRNLSGSGLGLYTASWLMERMGGSLSLHRPDSGGFEVRLMIVLAGREKNTQASDLVKTPEV